MGRNPHLGLFEDPASGDFEKAEAALRSVGLSDLASKPYLYDMNLKGQRIIVPAE